MRSSTQRRISSASSHLKSDLKYVTVSLIGWLFWPSCGVFFTVDVKTHHITQEAPEHILHFSSVFCSYQATWSRRGRGKSGARERTCVGRGESCVKIKGCRQSKAMCTIVLTQYPPPLQKKNPNPLFFLPGWKRIQRLWEKASMTCKARLS